MKTVDRFNEKYGAAHWLQLYQLMDSIIDFKATISDQGAYDDLYHQFVIAFPDGSSRLGTVAYSQFEGKED